MTVFTALMVLALPAHALKLNGTFEQGGLVIGHTDPGAKVSLDGKPVKVAANGAFVFGFGRDAKSKATLSVTTPDGQTETRKLTVAKQDYPIQRINGLPSRKVTPKPEDIRHIRSDNKKIGAVRATMTPDPRFLTGFTWPVTGPISGVFGSQRILNGKPKNPHNGVDIAAPKGSVIRAPADGVVALVVPDMFYTGKTIMIDHGLGLTSVYCHMSAILVAKGQVVHQGDPIGKVGQSGRATGPHLHWGVTWKGTHLDPALAAGLMPKG